MKRDRKSFRKRDDRRAVPAPFRPGLLPYLPVAALLVFGFFLRAISLGSDVGGFLAWNEANYLLIARNASLKTILFPKLGGGLLFLETPPLVPYLIALVSWGSQPGVLAGRLVSIFFS